jgi:hypothetical protein
MTDEATSGEPAPVIDPAIAVWSPASPVGPIPSLSGDRRTSVVVLAAALVGASTAPFAGRWWHRA